MNGASPLALLTTQSEKAMSTTMPTSASTCVMGRGSAPALSASSAGGTVTPVVFRFSRGMGRAPGVRGPFASGQVLVRRPG